MTGYRKRLSVVFALVFWITAAALLTGGAGNVYAGYEPKEDCGPNLKVYSNGWEIRISLKDSSIHDERNCMTSFNYKPGEVDAYPWKEGRKSYEVVDIGEGVLSIGDSAFADMPRLEDVYIPSSIQEIKRNAFARCSSDLMIYYNGRREQWEELVGNSSPIGNEILREGCVMFSNQGEGRYDLLTGSLDLLSGRDMRLVSQEMSAIRYSLKYAEELDHTLAVVFTTPDRIGYDLDLDGKEDIIVTYLFDIDEQYAYITTTDNCKLTGEKTIKMSEAVKKKCQDLEDPYFESLTFIFTKSIAGAWVDPIGDQEYTGGEIKPAPVVVLDGKTLKEGTDYMVSYANNVNAGTATVTMTGLSPYEGTLQTTFKIVRKEEPVSSGDTGKESKGEITPDSPAVTGTVEKTVLKSSSEKDLAGSTFHLLQAKGTAKSGTSVKLTWKKVPGAKKYVVYGSKCGKNKKYKKLKTVSGKSFTQKKLKKGTYYKYLIAAVNGKKTLAVSRTIHVATKGGKVGNHTRVALSRTKLSLAVGKSKTVKATLKKGSLKVKNHRKTAWESDNIKVATVSSKGLIKAVGKGTCYVYAYAQNGVCAKVKVTVK